MQVYKKWQSCYVSLLRPCMEKLEQQHKRWMHCYDSFLNWAESLDKLNGSKICEWRTWMLIYFSMKHKLYNQHMPSNKRRNISAVVSLSSSPTATLTDKQPLFGLKVISLFLTNICRIRRFWSWAATAGSKHRAAFCLFIHQAKAGWDMARIVVAVLCFNSVTLKPWLQEEVKHGISPE